MVECHQMVPMLLLLPYINKIWSSDLVVKLYLFNLLYRSQKEVKINTIFIATVQ